MGETHVLKLSIDRSPSTSEIVISSGITDRIADFIDPSTWTSVHVVTDKNTTEIAQSVAQQLQTENVVVVSNPEAQKSFAGADFICTELNKQKADRKSLVINVGGGALGDLGGFAASIYMRGIDFINVPTTLLAQVDASVGGKTGINAFGLKNSVGSFQQPMKVLVDPKTIQQLPEEQISNGFAELLKHGLICDKELWDELAQTTPQELVQDLETLDRLIFRSCQIKYDVVNQDEKEGDARKKLNFGHSVGHALESLSQTTDTPYLHGQAIALGMIVETQLSNLEDGVLEQIRTIFEKYGLPTADQHAFNTDHILEKIAGDKKNIGGKVSWTLLESVGAAIVDQSRSDEEVISALSEISQ